MARAGFDVIRRTSAHFHIARGRAPIRAAKTVLSLLARLRPSLGPEIVITAWKPLVTLQAR